MTVTAAAQQTPSAHTNAGRTVEPMTVMTHLLAAVGTLTAVVLILLMAAVPILLDLPLGRPTIRRPTLRRPTPKGR